MSVTRHTSGSPPSHGRRPAPALVQGRVPGEERGGVTVRPDSEHREIQNRFGRPAAPEVRSELVRIAIRRGLRRQPDRDRVNAGRRTRQTVQPVQAGRSVIAGGVVVGHQALVRPEHVQPTPGDGVHPRRLGEQAVQPARGAPARDRDGGRPGRGHARCNRVGDRIRRRAPGAFDVRLHPQFGGGGRCVRGHAHLVRESTGVSGHSV